MRVVEAFSGIGSQAKALKKLSEEIGLKYEIVNTIEWDINSIFAYDIIHHGNQEPSYIDSFNKEQLLDELMKYSLSYNGKEPLEYIQLFKFSVESLRAILKAIIRNKNLVNINTVNADNFPDNIDVLTYSFPCQDLSLSGYFHRDTGGISRTANNSSSLLWQVERILYELSNSNKQMPRILLMENVASIVSKRHIKDFEEWKTSLENLGYVNLNQTLNAHDFGIPQHRRRTFMISVYHGKNEQLEQLIRNNLNGIVVDNYQSLIKKYRLQDLLRLDYSNDIYFEEARNNVPNLTPSRKIIKDKNINIRINEKGVLNHNYIRTLTTKQDRHPNSGIVIIDKEQLKLNDKKADFRYLTSREAFLLMGYDESDYDRLLENNIKISNNNMLFTKFKLEKMAGNSIVVNVIKEVFRKIYELYLLLEAFEENI